MKSRAYDSGARPHDFWSPGAVAEIHFDDGRSVQISGRDDGTILLRMWGPNGTHEYGGNNMTELCASFVLTDHVTIDSMWFQPPQKPRSHD